MALHQRSQTRLIHGPHGQPGASACLAANCESEESDFVYAPFRWMKTRARGGGDWDASAYGAHRPPRPRPAARRDRHARAHAPGALPAADRRRRPGQDRARVRDARVRAEGPRLADGEGRLKPEVRTIVQVVADAGICLATGHLSVDEIRVLQDAAVESGVDRFVVTHANWALCKLDLDVQKELVAKGAYLEYVAVSCVSPIFWEQNPHELATWITELGGAQLVLSSDLGQLSAPPHPEGLRMLVASLLDEGLAYEHLERMLQHNPATLVGLD